MTTIYVAVAISSALMFFLFFTLPALPSRTEKMDETPSLSKQAAKTPAPSGTLLDNKEVAGTGV